MNQCMMLQNHALVKGKFKDQWVKQQYKKFIDSQVSDYILQLTFEKLLLVKFWYSIKEE